MFKNYIKTAIRSLNKNKGFTAINVLGLALGLAICLLIVFYVMDELSYDKYNTKADRIYRINDEIKFGGNEVSYAQSPAPAAATLLNEFPEVENVVRFRDQGGVQVKKGNQNIQEHKVIYSDPSVFDIFSLPMISGNPATALKDPNNVVIDETTAKKYFNRTDVVGQTIVFNDNQNFKVSGVIKDIPKQSHFQFNIFLPLVNVAESKDDSWLSNNFQTYILLKQGNSIQSVQTKLPQLVENKIGAQLFGVLHMTYADFKKTGNYFKLTAMPLRKIHLESNMVGELGQNGDVRYVYIFLVIALFILLIACVNFMNLSTARSANRAREVGVRKVLGSARKYLIAQFLAESMIITLISTIIALVIAWALLPLFNQMSGKELAVSSSSLTWLLPALVLIVVVIGGLAGSYPAFYLSAFQPIDVLKGKLAAGFKGGIFRSFLVVFQFAISIFLIIGTLVIYNQLKYIQNKDLGYNRNHVLVVKNIRALGTQAKIFKQEVKQLPGVADATLTGYTPTQGNKNSSAVFPSSVMDSKNAVLSQIWAVDEDYIRTLNMKLIKGRDFLKDMPTDSSGVILNESAVKQLHLSNAENKLVYIPQDSHAKVMKPFHVIGVVKDFNFNSLRENVSPMILTFAEDRGVLSVRISASNMPELLNSIENTWKSIATNQQFDYSFMDQDFDATYRAEQRIGKIFVAFTTLAIIIACLGLFGLAAYAAEQRTKEIGIRKVLGAGMSSIIGMLSKDFIRLVVIAILISAPLAWIAMQKLFLQGFAYRQDVQWWVVLVAGAGAILIAFVTISFQSIKAALINPVKSLRSE